MCKIRALLPALITNKKQEEMTKKALKSLVSFDHCMKIEVDNKKYTAAVAGVWNAFFDKWRGGDYEYLLVTANDVEHDPNAVDYMVRCLEENPEAGIVSIKVTRDMEEFKKGFGQRSYTTELTKGLKDPATFMLRKGVIEDVGRIDELFPVEFVERDFIYRLKLAGYQWVQPNVVLEYHPDRSGTVGNDMGRLNGAYRRYVQKWGGDANDEKFKYPYNNITLNYTYCKK